MERQDITTNEKKHVPMKPKQGFIAAAVMEFYTDLSKVKHDNPNLVKALKFAKRCYEKYLANDFDGEEPPKRGFVKVELRGSARLLK